MWCGEAKNGHYWCICLCVVVGVGGVFRLLVNMEVCTSWFKTPHNYVSTSQNLAGQQGED